MSESSLQPCLLVRQAESATRGSAFDMSIRELRGGERIEAAAGLAGEEVAAILEGSFSIEAAGEHYRLSSGEAIIIPPGAARAWTCTSATGVLYRVINQGGFAAGEAGAS
ncbi:hypothetical protein PWP93_30220 [Paraburkholderia sp. A1RI-2L]|uniref:cupin domain-containing protein n=1 Tax=Paraburkholderia sp. A1RI-2L TaxID=3028367 RepID=UPI003B7D5CDC